MIYWLFRVTFFYGSGYAWVLRRAGFVSLNYSLIFINIIVGTIQLILFTMQGLRKYETETNKKLGLGSPVLKLYGKMKYFRLRGEKS